MKFLMTLFYLFMFVLMSVFAFLNPTRVVVDYYWGSVNWPVGIIVVIGFALGSWLGLMMGSLKGRSIMKRKMIHKFSKLSPAQELRETKTQS
jgi:uncharacterized integral membrane protein